LVTDVKHYVYGHRLIYFDKVLRATCLGLQQWDIEELPLMLVAGQKCVVEWKHKQTL